MGSHVINRSSSYRLLKGQGLWKDHEALERHEALETGMWDQKRMAVLLGGAAVSGGI